MDDGHRAVAARNGVAPTGSVYRTAVDGFVADLTPAQRRSLQRDPAVRTVAVDRSFRLADVDAPQIIGTGVMRIGGLRSPSARIDCRDDRRVDADIAIIDSGVDVTHPDVNVVGGVDCSGSGTFTDGFGHGTFVADGSGDRQRHRQRRRGAGARIWSVRVVPRSQNIRESDLLCGFEWVTRNAHVLEIANISIGGGGADSGGAGSTGAAGSSTRSTRRSAPRSPEG